MTWKIHIYIYMGVSLVVHGCFQAISWVFQGYFKIISRVFQCDSSVCNGCARGDLRAFLSNWICIGSCHGFRMQSKPFLTKNILRHPWNTVRIHLNPSGNSHKMTLKHTPNTCESHLKHPRNTNLKINLYFTCQNDC